MNKISSFRGQYDFLSNFYESVVVWEGLAYRNAESAFQAAKVFNDRERFIGLSGSEAKRLGRHVPLRKDWEQVKIDTMHSIVLCKFQQNENLRQKLIATGGAYLEEGNTWGDTFWGVCNGDGANNLGRILMQVRKEVGGL